jgi:hypothetical protein
MSAGKSLSIFGASLGENVRLAAEAGDSDGVAYWSGLLGEFERAWDAACDAGLEYFAREAGYARTGDHTRRTDGAESGQWREADLVVATFLQHTSRAGDPQLHRHQVILHAARTRDDGKWRAPDSAGYHEHVRAAAAVTSVHFESELARRFALKWTARKDGNGFEIQGVTEQHMKALSSRRVAIDKKVQDELIPEFIQEYGRPPNQRELSSLYQGANLALRHGKDGLIDWDATRRLWAEKSIERAGERLETVAPRVWGYGEPGARATREPEPAPNGPERARAARMALEQVQSERPTWRRADLLASVGRLMSRTGSDPVRAVAELEELTDEILAGRYGKIVSLEAPSAVEIPAELMRADGKSLFERHGGARYATAEQLAREEEIVSLARGRAPALSRELAAQLLGAEASELDDALHGRVADAMERTTATGFRLDQAAIVFNMVTSGDAVDVVNAAAGSGKTTLAAIAAGIWEQAEQGQVVGIAPSTSARNTLSRGIAESYNTAQFLGHLPDERGARGAVAIDPDTLAVIDEGSMVSTADLVDLLRYVSLKGGKVGLLGDVRQLQAVESGGGMSMLARVLGYASLAQPVRMRELWERDASARLRAADLSALAEYDEHGRIRGGKPEEMLEAAARAYVAMTGEGQDALLVVATHELRMELGRRIQGYLADRGVVDLGRSVMLGNGHRAGVGDIIVCTANDNQVQTGDGQTLNNHGLFRVESVDGTSMTLRRVTDSGAGGARAFAEETFTYSDPRRFELGYAVTAHASQSRTVGTGIAVISGSETSEAAYVAMTRGAESNLVYVFSESPRKADAAPGFKPAEEIARQKILEAEQAGEDVSPSFGSEQALAVLADVYSRTGEELAATEYRAHALAQADNLGDLAAMWFALTTRIREDRYADLAREAVHGDLDDTHTARWLHRSMRNAELAGLDPAEVVRSAVDGAPLTGSRDVAAVMDYRVRRATMGLVPDTVQPWSEQVPEVDSPVLQQFLGELAAAMDERQARIGEHAAEHPEHWTEHLGPVPDEPVARLEWQERAGQVGAYRELFAFNHPTEAIGAEPGMLSPDRRALWYAASQALGIREDIEVGSLSDGSLELRVRQFSAETAWAPRDVSLALSSVRREIGDAKIEAANRDAEASAARERGEHEVADRHELLAAAARDAVEAHQAHESILAGLADDRAQWDQATGPQRKMAVAAHRELSRRHPEREREPLQSAEPEPIFEHSPELDAEALQAERTTFAERLAERESLMVPAEDTDLADLGQAFPSLDERDHGPILVPPRPEIRPSDRVLERGVDNDLES